MPIVILIPTVLCLLALLRWSVQRTFLNLYIPIFMMLPAYYYWKVATLPPVDLSEAICLPLGLAMAASQLRKWRFSIADFGMAVFVFTSFYSDLLRGEQTAATFDAFSTLCLAVTPYMAGKLLIEQNGKRVATLKRLVFCLFLASLFSVYEFRMAQNPFTLLVARFFPDESFPWKTQLRWGFGRVSGPFGQSELAGIMFFFALTLTLWLTHNQLWEPKFRHARWLPGRKATVIAATLAVLLYMTQARGPWLGALVALPVALIGRTRRVGRSALIVALTLVVGGAVTYTALKAYTSGPTTSEAQQNAAYRSQMLDNYIPVAEHGGPFGYGQAFPRIAGQTSIDNEYLFIALTQGLLGLAAFVLISAEAVRHLILAALRLPSTADRYFAWSLLGVFLGLLVTIFTVFLGNQPYQLFFLLAGWSQALRPQLLAADQKAAAATPAKLRFEQVYT
jgi:hypothetical protein